MSDGLIHTYEGKVLTDSGAIATADDCCCGCDETYNKTVRIAGYSDGDLTGCAACQDWYSGFGWNGTFNALSPCHFYYGGSLQRISWKLTASGGDVDISYSSGTWTMLIVCRDSVGSAHTIWTGTKSGGATPVGTYTRTAGCDTTGSLEVEEVP